MKNIKLKLIPFVIPTLVWSTIFSSCSVTEDTTLTISIEGDAELKVGEQKKYNVIFSNHSKTSDIRWTVGNDSILSIDNDGNIKALKAGKTSIKATVLNNASVFALKEITIKDAPQPENIIINGATVTYSGQWKQKYSANIYPQNASQQIVWHVDSPYASISTDGVLSVNSSYVSQITITAQSSVNTSLKSQFKVKVCKQNIVENIEIFGNDYLSPGQTWQYTSKILPLSTDNVCLWSLSQEYQNQYAYVDKFSGKVTAKNEGEIDLIAKSLDGKIQATKHVIISDNDMPRNAYIDGKTNIDSNSSATFSCKVELNSPELANAEWHISENAEIISASQTSTEITIKSKDGNVNPIYLTAQLIDYPSIKLCQKLNVGIKPNSISIVAPDNNTIPLNWHYDFTTNITPSAASKEVIWSSSNPGIIYINPNDGHAQSLSTGTSLIKCVSAFDNTILSEVNISVTEEKTVEIIGPTNVVEGNIYSFQAKVLPESEAQDVSWSVDKPEIATFNEGTGDLQARKEGKVIITATTETEPKVSATKEITVCEAPKKIHIIGNTLIPLDKTSSYSIDVEPEKGYKEVDWSIDKPEIATIDENGVLQPLQEGIVTLTAKSKYRDSISESITIEICSDVASVSFNPTNGKAFSVVGSSYGKINKDYTIQFVSTKMKPTEDEPNPRVIHKQLKKNDLEIIYDDANIIDECDLVNNILTIPAKYINNSKVITINILGAEISDWITWNQIRDWADEDAEDDKGKKPEEITHSIEQYFQIGDYKRVYDIASSKVVSDARLVSFYSAPYEELDEHHEKQVYYAPMQFECSECWFETDRYDDHHVVVPENLPGEITYYLPRWDGNDIERFFAEPKLKTDKLNTISLLDVSPRSICTDPKKDEHDAPINDSTLYILSADEYNFTESEIEVSKNGHWGEQGTDDITTLYEDNPCIYYTDSYHTIKTIADRRRKKNVDNNSYGYRTRDMYNGYTKYGIPDYGEDYFYFDSTGCIKYDGTQCRYYFTTDHDTEDQEGGYTKQGFCIAFCF